MASRLTLSVQNTGALAARFARNVPVAIAEVRRLIEENAEYEYRLVYGDCPVDTGFMRAHIVVFFDSDGLSYQLGWVHTDFGTAAGLPFYPPFVIYGTRFMAGRDFLFPNHMLARARFQKRLGRTVSKALRLSRAGGE